MNDSCYCCDECFETFEHRASMSKADKCAKGHRVRCPSCGSEATRQAAVGSRRPDRPEDHCVCTPFEAAWEQPGAAETRGNTGS
jgi:hypothetical protein